MKLRASTLWRWALLAMASCGDLRPAADVRCASAPYANGPYGYALNVTLPDATFASVDAQGRPTDVHLRDYFEPCAETPRLLMIRVGAAWCGSCRWHLAHTAELSALDIAPRVALLDLEISDEDNVPADRDDLAAYRARIDAPDAVALDPTFSLGQVLESPAALPLILVVDRRTMTLLSVLPNPNPDLLELRLRQKLAALDGVAAPLPNSIDTDGIDNFHRNEWDLLREMTLPGAPPPDSTNAFADDPRAAALGQQLFADRTLSPLGVVSCATCHDPTRHFADGRPQSMGVSLGDRNAPSVILASHARWQFWDGRADSLWAQALGPMENEREIGSSRLYVAHAIFDRYRASYEEIFGAMPSLDDAQRFPAHAKPGDATWDAMTADDREQATRVFVNAGKSIAAFERTLRAQPTALDAYVAGDASALNAEQKRGLHAFFTLGCIECHYGPRLTDDAFHVVRFPTGRQDGLPDRGRADGIAQLVASEFRADGPYSDDPAPRAHESLLAGPWTVGAMKTPTLRGISQTAPFGHGGTLATLLDVAKNYGTAGLSPGDPLAIGDAEPWLARFLGGHAPEIVPLLELLSAD